MRCEAVCELGSVVIGRPASGTYATMAEPHAGAGYWGGLVPADYRERFARAYDLEVQAWIDASRRGAVVGPTTYDGYAATVVSSAGMESLATGRPVSVHLAERPAYATAS